ncbi:MAG: SMC-Scp complex subunit ScpB [Planctomycetes bacterium]|nr:SMC-Scp complex subunit ScpB [Planctomycetota bacterium]
MNFIDHHRQYFWSNHVTHCSNTKCTVQSNQRLSKLFQARRETRLSQAALETLAIVAYKQPILRADIEAIRGVAAGEVLNRLRELNLVKIVGRAEEIGRPLLYGTTKKFLDVFGLGSLDDLPQDQELAQPDS